jgi:MOSC domain-containing protein YiiM
VQKSPGVLRRNVIVTAVDLHSLIGQTFEVQGVSLRGTGHCAPCHWLDQAFAPGTEAWLQNNGGLRAQILTDGWIRTDAAERAPGAA